ncbi:(2Fe-2S)-binding protein [Alcaligenaceae bacterium]|nr:(2Fe-2S)-binding protein [Alcaligenaceae bacterium]
MGGLLFRVAEQNRATLVFHLDGVACSALEGDTVLTAVLAHQTRLRTSEFDGMPRAGFCMMGACQDCWIWLETGERIRACTTLVGAGMRLCSYAGAVA